MNFNMKQFDYYEAPPDEIFEDIKDKAMKLWHIIDTDNDKYGYATEKIRRIKDLHNIKDNTWYIVAMFDHYNIEKLCSMVEDDTCDAIRNMLFQTGNDI
jgi:DNA-binding MltR family transcriptional regulator